MSLESMPMLLAWRTTIMSGYTPVGMSNGYQLLKCLLIITVDSDAYE